MHLYSLTDVSSSYSTSTSCQTCSAQPAFWSAPTVVSSERSGRILLPSGAVGVRTEVLGDNHAADTLAAVTFSGGTEPSDVHLELRAASRTVRRPLLSFVHLIAHLFTLPLDREV